MPPKQLQWTGGQPARAITRVTLSPTKQGFSLALDLEGEAGHDLPPAVADLVY